MHVLSKIDHNDANINWADELDGLFESVSIPKSDPLPSKFHRFVQETFSHWGHGDKVPPPAWFKKVIPLEDPQGITYYTLIRLQDLAPEYQPSKAPLEEHVYLLLIQGCAAHWESGFHDENCDGSQIVVRGARASTFVCEVCRLEEALVKSMDTDPLLAWWAGQNPKGTGHNTFFEDVLVNASEKLCELDEIELLSPI